MENEHVQKKPFFLRDRSLINHTDLKTHPKEDIAISKDTYNVCIIGCGIMGLSLCYSLLKQREEKKDNAPFNIIMIDQRGIGEAASGRNAGIMWPLPHLNIEGKNPLVLQEANMFQPEELREAHEFDYKYFPMLAEFLEEQLKEQNLVDKRRDYFLPCPQLDAVFDFEQADNEMYQYVVELTETLKIVTKEQFGYWQKKQCQERTHCEKVSSGNMYALGAQANPVWVTETLTKEIKKMIKNLPNTNVQFSLANVVISMKSSNNSLGQVQTSKGLISAKSIVLCTNAYTSQLVPTLSNIMKPCREHAFVTSAVHEDHILCTKPINVNYGSEGEDVYIRSALGNKLIIGGMREFSAKRKCEKFSLRFNDQELDRSILNRIHQQLDMMYPNISKEKFKPEMEWCGLICKTIDGRPLIGPLPGNFLGQEVDNECTAFYMAAGFCGDGMSKCFGAGKYLASIMMDKNAKCIRPFLPERFLPLLSEENNGCVTM